MDRCEWRPMHANGGKSEEQPGSSNLAPRTILSHSGQLWNYTAIKSAAATGNGPNGFYDHGDVAPELAVYSTQRPESSENFNISEDYVINQDDAFPIPEHRFSEAMETGQDDGALSASSFNSVISESFTYSTMTSLEQGEEFEDSDVWRLDNIEEIDQCPTALTFLPHLQAEYEDQFSSYIGPDLSVNCKAQSMLVSIENNESFNDEGPVTTADKYVVHPEVSRSGSKWPGFVWLVRACHRLKPKTDISFKGVYMKERGSVKKYCCEIRIMKRIRTKPLKSAKVWLGTYATPEQAARALDVGKFFLCAKEKRSFFDPNSESVLSTFKDRLLAQPVADLVKNVKNLANHYGKNGSLQNVQLQ